ncbi:MAG: hypothetical protein ACK5Y2_05045 [Bdellovibrionales bacterium]
MRIAVVLALFLVLLPALACLFEIENSDLDSTCSSDITSYQLDTYYALRPPKIKIKSAKEFDRIRVRNVTYPTPREFVVFDRITRENELVEIEFLKGSKTYRKIRIQKLPKEFPKMKVQGEASPGYFVMAAMRVNGSKSFALVLDQKGNIVFFRAYSDIVCDFQKQGSKYFVSRVEKMVRVSMLGYLDVYSDLLKQEGKIEKQNVKTDWGSLPVDLHDFIYLNDNHYFYIRNYPAHDLFWGCVLQNEIVEYKDGVEKVIFSSQPFLSYKEIDHVRWPIFLLIQCHSYFHLNSMQYLGMRRFLLSSRSKNEIYLWSDLSPIQGWVLGARSEGLSPDLVVRDWLGQHTPDYSREAQQIVMFDNGKDAKPGLWSHRSESSSIVTVDLDQNLNPVRSKRILRLSGHTADTMGSTQWFDKDTVTIGAGHSVIPKKFDLKELSLNPLKVTFNLVFLDKHVMVYRVRKIKSLD